LTGPAEKAQEKSPELTEIIMEINDLHEFDRPAFAFARVTSRQDDTASPPAPIKRPAGWCLTTHRYFKERARERHTSMF